MKLYFCGTDLIELEFGATDIIAYSSLKSLKAARKCLDECGIISIEVTNVKWLKKSDFFGKRRKSGKTKTKSRTKSRSNKS